MFSRLSDLSSVFSDARFLITALLSPPAALLLHDHLGAGAENDPYCRSTHGRHEHLLLASIKSLEELETQMKVHGWFKQRRMRQMNWSWASEEKKNVYYGSSEVDQGGRMREKENELYTGSRSEQNSLYAQTVAQILASPHTQPLSSPSTAGKLSSFLSPASPSTPAYHPPVQTYSSPTVHHNIGDLLRIVYMFAPDSGGEEVTEEDGKYWWTEKEGFDMVDGMEKKVSVQGEKERTEGCSPLLHRTLSLASISRVNVTDVLLAAQHLKAHFYVALMPARVAQVQLIVMLLAMHQCMRGLVKGLQQAGRWAEEEYCVCMCRALEVQWSCSLEGEEENERIIDGGGEDSNRSSWKHQEAGDSKRDTEQRKSEVTRQFRGIFAGLDDDESEKVSITEVIVWLYFVLCLSYVYITIMLLLVYYSALTPAISLKYNPFIYYIVP